MSLKDLMAISGYPGLYRFISQGRNAIIVESLADRKRMSVHSTSKISTLEEIAVFTDSEELPLSDVFKRMYRHSDGKEVLSHKSQNEEIKKFFEEVLPEYDRERVYVSDMKKVINWYNLLIKYELLKPEDEDKDEPPKSGAGKPDDKDKQIITTEKKTGGKTEEKLEEKSEEKTEETTEEKSEEKTEETTEDKRKNPPKGEK